MLLADDYNYTVSSADQSACSQKRARVKAVEMVATFKYTTNLTDRQRTYSRTLATE